MTEETLELPDMDELARQMEDAMAKAREAMQDLPTQMDELDDVVGSLSALMGGMPAQIEKLNSAMAAFGEQHEANVESMAGEPDWSVEASIQVGEKLHIVVDAAFDLAKIKEAWTSTQGAEFASLVQGVVAGTGDTDAGLASQIVEQLKKGRNIAIVKDIEVLACRIQGAPKNAAQELQLSPEGNIPLMMDENGLGFEFAPLLTIRNRWENANTPTFLPMGEEIVVELVHFENGEPFKLEFKPSGQEDQVTVALNFQPLV